MPDNPAAEWIQRAIDDAPRANPFREQPFPPGCVRVPPPIARQRAGRRLDEAEPAVASPVDEGFFRLLLEGVQEILEVPGMISGPAALELLLKAPVVRAVTGVVVQHKNVNGDFEAFDILLNQCEQLGWGAANVQPAKQDRFWSKFQFNVKSLPVALLFTEQPEVFDNFEICTNMVAYTLEDGLVVDPRAQKDLDNGTVTCNKPLDAKRLVSYQVYVEHLSTLTGKKFKLIKKKDK